MKRLLREPLVQFLLVGTVLFAANSYLDRGRGGGESSKQIDLTLDELRAMDVYFQSQWRRHPTPDEFRGLVENRVREEVLYREALAMGLDKNDTIVKRRMAQKMQFLAEDVAAAHAPTTAELKSWFAKNEGRFTLPGRVSFRHLYFSSDRRGERAREDAVTALGKLAGRPEDAKGVAALGDPFMFQDYYADRAPEQLAKEFGPGFAQAVFKLETGGWKGPVESGYGWHLVFVDSAIPGRLSAFEEVESDVKTAWLGVQKEEAWRKAYDAMRARYTVRLPGPPEPGGESPTQTTQGLPPPGKGSR